MSELKNCPVCDRGTDNLHTVNFVPERNILEVECVCGIKFFGSPENWNTRQPDPEIKEDTECIKCKSESGKIGMGCSNPCKTIEVWQSDD